MSSERKSVLRMEASLAKGMAVALISIEHRKAQLLFGWKKRLLNNLLNRIPA
jgi:hypothetical protein